MLAVTLVVTRRTTEHGPARHTGPPSGMGTIDLDAGPDCWAPTERKAGELLGQLERGKGNRHTVRASNAGHPSEYAQALSEANAKRLLAAAEELEG